MTESVSEVDTEETKKPVKEVPVVQEQGYFQHDTLDTYDGFFEAKKKDKSVKMHGPGVYTTAEGDIYSGTWNSDRLGGTDEVTITYNDNSKYEGLLKESNYSGFGSYTYPDGSILQCEFVENCPVGSLQLTDPNGHIWLGKAQQGFGWFEPVNHYYEILEKTRDSHKARRHKSRSPVIEPMP